MDTFPSICHGISNPTPGSALQKLPTWAAASRGSLVPGQCLRWLEGTTGCGGFVAEWAGGAVLLQGGTWPPGAELWSWLGQIPVTHGSTWVLAGSMLAALPKPLAALVVAP